MPLNAAAIRATFGMDATGARAEMKKLQREGGKFAKQMSGSFARAFGAAAVIGFAKSTVNLADQLDKTSKKVDLSVETLQKYQFAASQAAGIQKNQLNIALQRFARRVAEAAKGKGELLGVLKQYNIAVTDTEGKTKSTEQIFRDYANTIAGVKDKKEQLRLAFKAFDSEGAALVNLMREGTAGLDKFGGEAERLGGIIKQDTITQLVELSDNLSQGLLPLFNVMAKTIALAKKGLDTLGAAAGVLAEILSGRVMGASHAANKALSEIWGSAEGAAGALSEQMNPALEASTVDMVANAEAAGTLAGAYGELTQAAEDAQEAFKLDAEKLTDALARQVELEARKSEIAFQKLATEEKLFQINAARAAIAKELKALTVDSTDSLNRSVDLETRLLDLDELRKEILLDHESIRADLNKADVVALNNATARLNTEQKIVGAIDAQAAARAPAAQREQISGTADAGQQEYFASRVTALMQNPNTTLAQAQDIARKQTQRKFAASSGGSSVGGSGSAGGLGNIAAHLPARYQKLGFGLFGRSGQQRFNLPIGSLAGAEAVREPAAGASSVPSAAPAGTSPGSVQGESLTAASDTGARAVAGGSDTLSQIARSARETATRLEKIDQGLAAGRYKIATR